MVMVSYGPVTGSWGIALPLPVPDVPRCAPVMQHWLVNAPGYHPDRDQYAAALISLADYPGLAPLHRAFPGATHEFAVLPLDPGYGYQSAATIVSQVATGTLHWAEGCDLRCQGRSGDADAAEVAASLVAAIVCQGWSPDITPDPAGMRSQWQSAFSRNLAEARQADLAQAGAPPP
jgi:hypothetical protein